MVQWEYRKLPSILDWLENLQTTVIYHFKKAEKMRHFLKKMRRSWKKTSFFLYLYHRSSCRVWCERISSLRSKICITFSFSRYLCILVKYYPATNSKRTFVISYKVLMTKVVFFFASDSSPIYHILIYDPEIRFDLTFDQNINNSKPSKMRYFVKLMWFGNR